MPASAPFPRKDEELAANDPLHCNQREVPQQHNELDSSDLIQQAGQYESDGLPASCSRPTTIRSTTEQQQQVPLSCKQRGQRFVVNSLPGRKTFSSKETIYLE
ncbi:hypothetical protein KIL84_008081 [Mauremys mutica]|uniref:Uncharacterized protein n=1 Tax=Mauremys mutica TaxID=74926 RepID=A0A9D3X3Y7_9SAUR|nr:hypothetical protein KIL84_008081 [Mauremys mutica]